LGFEDSKFSNLRIVELISGIICRIVKFSSFFKICFLDRSGSKLPPKIIPDILGDAEKLGESDARFRKIPEEEARAQF